MSPRTRRTRPVRPRPARVPLGLAAGVVGVAVALAGLGWMFAAGAPDTDPSLVSAKGSFVSLALALGALLMALQITERRMRLALVAMPGVALLLTLPMLVATWAEPGPGFHPWWVLVPTAVAHGLAVAALVGASRR